MCMFCRSLFVLLSFFFWVLFCLFFDIRILIIPLVSSNSFNKDIPETRRGIFEWTETCAVIFFYSCIVIKDPIIELGVMIPWIPLIGLIGSYYLPINMVCQMFEVQVVGFLYWWNCLNFRFIIYFLISRFDFQKIVFLLTCVIYDTWTLLNVIKWHLNIHKPIHYKYY